MLVTILSPVIGSGRAAKIAPLASDKGLTLKDAALKPGYLSGEDFHGPADPYKMTYPQS